MLCECRPTIGQRSIVQVFSANSRVSNDVSQPVALIRCRIAPAFQALIKRSMLRTYNCGLIRMITFKLFVSASGHSSPALEHIPLSYLIEFKAINRPEDCALVYTTSHPDMFVRKTLLVALVILWSTVCVFCSYAPGPCTKPAVRREWRAFSTEEKAEWIHAIKVRIDTLIGRLAKKRYPESSACQNSLMTRL